MTLDLKLYPRTYRACGIRRGSLSPPRYIRKLMHPRRNLSVHRAKFDQLVVSSHGLRCWESASGRTLSWMSSLGGRGHSIVNRQACPSSKQISHRSRIVKVLSSSCNDDSCLEYGHLSCSQLNTLYALRVWYDAVPARPGIVVKAPFEFWLTEYTTCQKPLYSAVRPLFACLWVKPPFCPVKHYKSLIIFDKNHGKFNIFLDSFPDYTLISN